MTKWRFNNIWMRLFVFAVFGIGLVSLQVDRCLWTNTAMTLFRLVFGRFPARISIVLPAIQSTAVAVCILPYLREDNILRKATATSTSS